MMKVCIALGLCVAVMGCINREQQIPFDGEYYRAVAKKDGKDRQDITVSVRPASASIVGAQEAGRHASAKYCIENYGNSAVEWIVGPDDDPETYSFSGDTLVLSGRCEG